MTNLLSIASKRSPICCHVRLLSSTIDEGPHQSHDKKFYSASEKHVGWNSLTTFSVQPIGVIRSPYRSRFQTPKQATIYDHSDGIQKEGKIQLFSKFYECIDQLEGFDYIWVLSYMHLNSDGFKNKIKPQPRTANNYNANSRVNEKEIKEVGLFCSRSPHRPNRIALSALRLTNTDISKGIITVSGLDLLDGEI